MIKVLPRSKAKLEKKSHEHLELYYTSDLITCSLLFIGWNQHLSPYYMQNILPNEIYLLFHSLF